MQISPRYGSDPIITLDGDPTAIAAPAIRQRQRLLDTLAAFDDEQWAHPSRCAGWTNRDVIVHLDSTNFFWTMSIEAGLNGAPTEFLSTFDPVDSPAQLVAGSQDVEAAKVLERFTASSEKLNDQLKALSDSDWSATAEAPPGHLSVNAVVHHALWDSWVHERDVILPLGMTPIVEPDEVGTTIRYAVALSPSFALMLDPNQVGGFSLRATNPDVSLDIEIDGGVHVRDGEADSGFVLEGDAEELLEALSFREPLTQPIPADSEWIFAGLRRIFDQ